MHTSVTVNSKAGVASAYLVKSLIKELKHQVILDGKVSVPCYSFWWLGKKFIFSRILNRA